MELRQQITNFEGLLPGIDRKRVEKPFVVDGANFFMTIDGPKSGLNTDEIARYAVDDPRFLQSFRVENDVYYFIKDGVLRFDYITRTMQIVFTFAEQVTIYPWSMAPVGGKYYFVRRGVDLIEHDPVANTWMTLTGGSYPANPVAVTQSLGRLIIASLTAISWSAIDNGADLVPSIATGAGSQSLAIIQNGESEAVLSTKDGFIVYTTSGLLKATSINAVTPFNFRILTQQFTLYNPFSVIQLADDSHILLSRKGLFQTAGGVPEPWQPIMSEYLIQSILPQFNITLTALVRLTYINEMNMVAISLATNQLEGVYQKAYLLYEPSNKWGSFDREHTGVIDLYLTSGVNIGFQVGFVDARGSLMQFTGATVRRAWRLAETFDYIHSAILEPPVIVNNGIYEMPSMAKVESIDTSVLAGFGVFDLRGVVAPMGESPAIDTFLLDSTPVTVLGGVYEMPSDANAGTIANGIGELLLLLENQTTDAFITIGPLRMTENIQVDELSEITNAAIGMLEAGSSLIVEDLMAYAADIVEDLLTSTLPDEDYGEGLQNGSIYTLTITSTVDAYRAWENQSDSEVFVIENHGRVIEYALDNLGVYHLLKFDSTGIDEAFHLKTVEISGRRGGRLY